MLKVGKVEIDDIARPTARNVCQQSLTKIAVRINKAEALPRQNVLNGKIMQQRGFARARFAKDVEVTHALGKRKRGPPSSVCASQLT